MSSTFSKTVKTKLEHTLENIAREDDDDEEETRKTMRSSSSSSRYSPHVREFLASRTCREMQTDERFRSWTKKKSLVKEIDEAMACKKQIERILQRDGIDGREGLTFVDLCSGKGFLSIVLSFAFPNAKVEMIDVDESANVEHVKAMKNVRFHRVDVKSKECEKIVEEAGNVSTCVMICGVHLCGDLSRVAIRLWRDARRKMNGRAALVLSPCCLPQRRRHDAFGFHVKDQAKTLNVDNYRLWCIFLSLEMKRCLMEDEEVEKGVGVHMVQDEFMSGRDVKNTFLSCCCAKCPLALPSAVEGIETNGTKRGISASILQASRWKISKTR